MHNSNVWIQIHGIGFGFSSLQVIAMSYLAMCSRHNIMFSYIWLELDFSNALNYTNVSNIRMYGAVVNHIHTDLGYYVTIQVTLYFIGFI